VIPFQPLITIMGTGSDAADQATQEFSRWFDGLNVSQVQFKVEIVELFNANLILESCATIDQEPHAWQELLAAVAIPTDGFEIVTALSTDSSPQYGVQFSRYIRWRATYVAGTPWHLCFRIKALVGDSFTQWPETPRIV